MAEARKVFEQEIANVEQQIRVLRQRREHLRALLGTYSQPASSPAAAVASRLLRMDVLSKSNHLHPQRWPARSSASTARWLLLR